MILPLLFISLILPRFEMSVEPGFEGVCRRESWIPLKVTIAPRERPAVGHLIIRFENHPFEAARVWAEIPSYSRRRVRLILPPGAGAVLASFLREGAEEAMEKSRIELLREQDILIGLISPIREEMPIDGRAISVDPSPLTGGQIVKVVLIPPRRIPSLLELSQVDILVLRDYLADPGRSILRRWAAMGGVLVTVRGFEDPELTPVEVEGESIVRLGGCGLPSLKGRRAEVARCRPKGEARAILKDGTIPLAFKSGYGDGALAYLAFDPFSPPFSSAQASIELWEHLIRATRPPIKLYRVYDPRRRFQRELISALRSELKPRTALWLAGSIGAYLAVLSSATFLGIRLRRPISPLIPISIALSLSAWLLIPRLNPTGVRSFELVRVYGDGTAFKRRWVVIGSAFKADRSFEIEGEAGIVPLTSAAPSIWLGPEGELLMRLRLDPFSPSALLEESVVVMRAMEVRLEGGEAVLRNGLGEDLGGLIVSCSGKVGFLRKLGPGAEVRVKPERELSYGELRGFISEIRGLEGKVLRSALREGELDYLVREKLDFVLAVGRGMLLIYRPL